MFELGVDAEEWSKARYYYSGGSLREFYRDLTELEEQVEKTLSAISVSPPAIPQNAHYFI